MMPGFELAEIAVGDGQRLAVHHAGSGAPIVLIHGAGAGASGLPHFRRNIPAFIDAGFRVIVPDLLGYGASSKPVDERGYPLERFTDTLATALDALGVKNAALFGNSLGGAISIDMALRRPDLVRKAILLAPGAMEERETYGALPRVQQLSGFFRNGISEAAMAELLRSLVGDPGCVEDDVIALRTAIARDQPPEVASRMVLPNLSVRIADVRAPLLVFWGADDGICPVEGALRFARHGQNAIVTIFSGVGHWPMTERAEEVNRASLAFLRD